MAVEGHLPRLVAPTATHATTTMRRTKTTGLVCTQLLPTSIVTATAWWQLTVLVSVADQLLRMSAAFAEGQELQKELVTATAMFLTSVVFVEVAVFLQAIAIAMATNSTL